MRTLQIYAHCHLNDIETTLPFNWDGRKTKITFTEHFFLLSLNVIIIIMIIEMEFNFCLHQPLASIFTTRNLKNVEG